ARSVKGTRSSDASLITRIRPPMGTVGSIEPLGTSFHSATAARTSTSRTTNSTRPLYSRAASASASRAGAPPSSRSCDPRRAPKFLAAFLLPALLEHPRLGELHAELPFGIHPHARHAQIRLRRELGEALERVLVAAFGPDVLAAFDRDFLIADVHTLILLADEVHLDAAHVFDPNRGVLEDVVIEDGVELAVEMTKRVQVELGRHAGRIVVRPMEHARILAQIDADEQLALTSDQRADPSQQRLRFISLEVPD